MMRLMGRILIFIKQGMSLFSPFLRFLLLSSPFPSFLSNLSLSSVPFHSLSFLSFHSLFSISICLSCSCCQPLPTAQYSFALHSIPPPYLPIHSNKHCTYSIYSPIQTSTSASIFENTSHDITSHHTTSHHTTSHDITPHPIT